MCHTVQQKPISIFNVFFMVNDSAVASVQDCKQEAENSTPEMTKLLHNFCTSTLLHQKMSPLT